MCTNGLLSNTDGVFAHYNQRAFSFVIEEASGHMTVAIARDGLSVTVFGVCTDKDV